MAITEMLDIKRDDPRWYIARHKPAQAWRALKALDRSCVDFRYPLFRDHHKELPLIPGYVFVHLPPDEELFADINELDGIDRLLPFHCENPLAVPAKWMDNFLSNLNNRNYDNVVEQPEQPLSRFNRNEILAVISGPFVGHTGTFVRVRKGAIDLDVTFFGRQMTVPFKGHEIQRLM